MTSLLLLLLSKQHLLLERDLDRLGLLELLVLLEELVERVAGGVHVLAWLAHRRKIRFVLMMVVVEVERVGRQSAEEGLVSDPDGIGVNLMIDLERE